MKLSFSKIVAVVIIMSVHKISMESVKGIRKKEIFRYK